MSDQDIKISADVEGLSDFDKLEKILSAVSTKLGKASVEFISYNEKSEIATFTTQKLTKDSKILQQTFDIQNGKFRLVEQRLASVTEEMKKAATAQSVLNAAISQQPEVKTPKLKAPSVRQLDIAKTDIEKVILSALPKVTADTSDREANRFKLEVDRLNEALAGQKLRGGRTNILTELLEEAQKGAVGTGNTIRDKLLNQINAVIAATKEFGNESKIAAEKARKAAEESAKKAADAATLENTLRSRFPVSASDKQILSASEVSRSELAINKAKSFITKDSSALDLNRALQIIDEVQNKAQLNLTGIENSFARSIRTLQLTGDALGRSVARGTDASTFEQRQRDALEVSDRLKKTFALDPKEFTAKQIGNFNEIISGLQTVVATGNVSKDKLFKILDSIRNKTSESFSNVQDTKTARLLVRLINLYDQLGKSATKASSAQKTVEERTLDAQKVIDALTNKGNNAKAIQGATPEGITQLQSKFNTLINRVLSGKITGQQVLDISDRITADPNKILVGLEGKVAKELKSIQKGFDDVGTAGTSAGKAITLSWESVIRIFQVQVLHTAIAQLISNLTNTVSDAAKFQVSISEIETITQDASTSTREWSESLRNLSDDFSLDLIDTTKASYDALSNQVARGADSIQFLGESAAFAKTTVTTLANAGNLLASVQNAYSTSIVETNRNASVLFDLIDKGRVTSAELANSFGNVAALSQAAGISLEETSAALSTLTVQGIRYNVAYTLLNNITAKLLKPTEEMKKLFDEWGVSTGQQAIQAFGLVGVLERLNQVIEQRGPSAISEIALDIRPIRGILGLTGASLKTFEKNYKDALDPAVAERFQKATNTIVESAGAKFQRQANAIKNVFTVDFGTGFLETIISINEILGEFQQKDGQIKFVIDDSGIGGTLQFIVQETKLVGQTFSTVAKEASIAIGTISSALFNNALGDAGFRIIGTTIQMFLVPAITLYLINLAKVRAGTLLAGTGSQLLTGYLAAEAAATSVATASKVSYSQASTVAASRLQTFVNVSKAGAASLLTFNNALTLGIIGYTTFIALRERALTNVDTAIDPLQKSNDEFFDRQIKLANKASAEQIRILESEIREKKRILAQYSIEQTKALQESFKSGFKIDLLNPAAANSDLLNQQKDRVKDFEAGAEKLQTIQSQLDKLSGSLTQATRDQATFANELKENLKQVATSFLDLTKVSNKAIINSRVKFADITALNQFDVPKRVTTDSIKQKIKEQVDIVNDAIFKAEKESTEENISNLRSQFQLYEKLISGLVAGTQGKTIRIFDFEKTKGINELVKDFDVLGGNIDQLKENGEFFSSTLEKAKERLQALRDSISDLGKSEKEVTKLRDEFEELNKSIEELPVEKKIGIKIDVETDSKTFEDQLRDKKSAFDKLNNEILERNRKAAEDIFKKSLEANDKKSEKTRENLPKSFVSSKEIVAELNRKIKDLDSVIPGLLLQVESGLLDTLGTENILQLVEEKVKNIEELKKEIKRILNLGATDLVIEKLNRSSKVLIDSTKISIKNDSFSESRKKLISGIREEIRLTGEELLAYSISANSAGNRVENLNKKVGLLERTLRSSARRPITKFQQDNIDKQNNVQNLALATIRDSINGLGGQALAGEESPEVVTKRVEKLNKKIEELKKEAKDLFDNGKLTESAKKTEEVGEKLKEVEDIIKRMKGGLVISFENQLIETMDIGRKKIEELRKESERLFAAGDIDAASKKLEEFFNVIEKLKESEVFKQIENSIKGISEQITESLTKIKDLVNQRFRTQLDFKLAGTDDEAKKTKLILDYVRDLRSQAVRLYDINNLDEARKKFEEINGLLKDVATRQIEARAKVAKFGVRFTTPLIADTLVKSTFDQQIDLENRAVSRLQNTRNQLQELADLKNKVPQLLGVEVRVDTSQVDSTSTKIEELIKKLNELSKARTIQLDIQANGPGVINPPGFSKGGLIGGPPRGDDTLIWAKSGEMMMTEQATQRFSPLLKAMNSGFSPRTSIGNSSTINLGGMTINVDGGDNPQTTAREIGQALRREIRRGTIQLK